MKWEDIKRKLTSRKFWIMLMTLVGIVCIVLNIDSFTTEKVMGVIAAFSILVVYIIGETVTDIANKKSVGEVVVTSMATKLSSRKFWAAIISFTTVLLVTLGVDTLTIEQVRTLILGIGTVAVYILGESAIDASKITSDIITEIDKIEDLTDSMLEEVGTNIKPMTTNWTKMIVRPLRGTRAIIYTSPDFNTSILGIPSGTAIYVEKHVYNGRFYRFITDTESAGNTFTTYDGSAHQPLFIEIDDVLVPSSEKVNVDTISESTANESSDIGGHCTAEGSEAGAETEKDENLQEETCEEDFEE